MKKKIIIVVISLFVIAFLFPYRLDALNDGGTMIFKSLVYEVKKIKKLKVNEVGYEKGVVINLFGKTIYKHFNPELIISTKKQDLTELYTINDNAKVFTEMEIVYHSKKEKISLKEALEKKEISMETMEYYMEKVSTLEDGSLLLKNNDLLSKKTFYLVKCNINKNYYFGLSDAITSYCEIHE